MYGQLRKESDFVSHTVYDNITKGQSFYTAKAACSKRNPG